MRRKPISGPILRREFGSTLISFLVENRCIVKILMMTQIIRLEKRLNEFREDTTQEKSGLTKGIQRQSVMRGRLLSHFIRK